MALEYRIDLDNNLVHLHLEGRPTLEAVTGLVDAAVGSPVFRKGMSWLIDRRDVEEAPTPEYAHGLREMLELRLARLGHCKCAIVANPGVAFGMARMQEALLEPLFIEVKVFTELAAALTWAAARASREG